jgi:hypothetical protein
VGLIRWRWPIVTELRIQKKKFLIRGKKKIGRPQHAHGIFDTWK